MLARVATGLLCALLAPAAAQAADPFLRRTASVEAVERVGPAVVNITTERSPRPRQRRALGNPFFDRFFNDFFEPRLRRRAPSLGSGVVIDAQGRVLTNAHVVAGAEVIRVTLADGREFGASLTGSDANNDLAVLQLEDFEDVPWIAPGVSEDLMVGEPVIAIGNPFGLSNSVTTGVVSATGRSIRQDGREYHGFLQTDASINPGNSGGPLLNARGELIGINTAIYRHAQGIGFAIPIDVAKRVVHELITKGVVAPVWLGLSLQDLSPALREAMQLPEDLSGALVAQVRSDGPAAQSQLQRGDVITAIGNGSVGSARALYEHLERATVGQALMLRLWRAGRELKQGVRAEEIPAQEIEQLGELRLGLRLRPTRAAGYLIDEVRADSGAAKFSLRAGDRLLSLQGRVLADQASLFRALLDLRGRTRAALVVLRGRRRYHLTIPLS